MYYGNTRRIGLGLLLPLWLFGLACASAQAAETYPGSKLAAQLAADGTTRKTIVLEGGKTAFFCANCHGDNGNSKYPDVPNLAGQHPDYLLKQMDAFLTGARKNTFMEGMIKVLNEHDKAAIALFYADATVTPASTPGPRAAEGKAYFAKLCARCHNADARGGEGFPRLAGQQREYIRLSLTRYLTQSGERFYAPMTAAVMQLGEANIDAVADYLAALN